MNLPINLPRLVALIRSRNGLLVVAGILLLLNGVRLINGKYAEISQSVESKQALLEQYRMSSKDLVALRARIQQLDSRKGQFERYLFSGQEEKEVTSAMQIKLQEALGRAGLTPESLSPAPSRGSKEVANAYGEVQIKLRVGGTQEGLLKFLLELAKMESLFVVDNITVKPFKKEELKVFLELRGFYRLPAPPEGPAPVKREPVKKASESGKKGGGRP